MLIQEEWKIKVPWGNLAMRRWGTRDGPPVLVVHGRQDSSSVFEPLMLQLPAHFNYIAFDMPGNGLSDPFPRGLKLMRLHFLAAMEMAVAHLGWKRFTFIGHSMGCEQGLYFNVVHPGMITKMILLDAGPTLMRMQIDDPKEFQQKYYDTYYDNYQWENFGRKVHTRKTALSAMSRLRGIPERLAIPLLERNFHVIENEGTKNSDSASVPSQKNWRPEALQDKGPSSDNKKSDLGSKSNLAKDVTKELVLERPQGSALDKTQELTSGENGNSFKVSTTLAPTTSQYEVLSTNSNTTVLPYVNHPLLTYEPPKPPIDLTTIYEPPKRVANPWIPILNFPQKTIPPLPRIITPYVPETPNIPKKVPPTTYEVSDHETRKKPEYAPGQDFSPIQDVKNPKITPPKMQSNLRTIAREQEIVQKYRADYNAKLDVKKAENIAKEAMEGAENVSFLPQMHPEYFETQGYLSWDNRLKNLAPTNYRNAYYFKIFKGCPPTILIRASEGANNMDPELRKKGEILMQYLETNESNFKIIDVEGGHDVHYTNPERVVEFVRGFLLDEPLNTDVKVASKL